MNDILLIRRFYNRYFDISSQVWWVQNFNKYAVPEFYDTEHRMWLLFVMSGYYHWCVNKDLSSMSRNIKLLVYCCFLALCTKNILLSVDCVFRSTLLSQPNKVALNCSYIRQSTKSFFDINEIWQVGRRRWVMHDGMQYDPIQGQGHKPLEVGNRSISKSYLLRHLQWELATEHWFLNYCIISEFDWSGRIFDIGFCVTSLWTWQKRQLWRVDRLSCTGLIYLCLHHLTLSAKALCFVAVLFVRSYIHPVRYCYHDISWMARTILIKLTVIIHCLCWWLD